MFESKEEEDAEVKKQIEAALDTMDPLGELALSESEDDSESESSDDDDDDEDPNVTKQYYQDQEDEAIGESKSKPSDSKAATTTDPPAIPDNSGNPGSSKPDVSSENTLPAKPAVTKVRGPNNENSGKAPALKLQLLAAVQGVQECVQSTLFGGAALAQALGSEEDTIRCLENYTSLLTGLQKLVGTMASGYEAATEDI